MERDHVRDERVAFLGFYRRRNFPHCWIFCFPALRAAARVRERANAEFSPFLPNFARDDNIQRRSCGNPQLLFFGFSVSRSTDCIESSLGVNINESTALATLGIPSSDSLVNESQNTTCCWSLTVGWNFIFRLMQQDILVNGQQADISSKFLIPHTEVGIVGSRIAWIQIVRFHYSAINFLVPKYSMLQVK